MNVQPAVRKETARIAIGVALLTLIMVLVFWLLGRLDYTVLLGALLGACAAVANFFLMALGVQYAAEQMNGVTLPPYPEEDEADEQAEPEAAPEQPLPEVQRAKQRMQLSYTGRMLFLVAVAILALSVPCFHPVAAVLPLLFPRIVIFILGFLKPKQEEA